MKTYQTNDGAVIKAEDTRDVVRKLRALSHEREPSFHEFMEAVAARISQTNGVSVPTDTTVNFVAGLVQAGLLKEVP